jgi:hypothetical protein
MNDIGDPDRIEHSARVQAEHYRKLATPVEPLTSGRRHLRWLAAQYDEMAEELETPQLSEPGTSTAVLD